MGRQWTQESATAGASAELLAQWSRRYRTALERFFHRRMPRGADREDLVQEVFLNLARRDDLTTVEQIDGYLFQAAANVLTDWRRKQATHAASAHDAISETLEDVGFTPERVLIGKDTVGALIAALGRLPVKTRTVFMLYHFEFLPHAEIGRRLGMAVRTVEDHMARANAHLLSVMGDLR